MIRRGDVEPRVGASGCVGDEVGERLMERSNRMIGILLKDKERIGRRQEKRDIFDIESQECGDRGWRKGIDSKDNSAEGRTGLGVILWVIVAKTLLENLMRTASPGTSPREH